MNLLLALLLAGANESEITEPKIQLTTKEKLAPFASLLLPGTGELMRGYKLKGELFLWSDVFAMSGVAGFGWSAANRRQAAIGMAAIDAHANPDNRTAKYLRAMENYISTEDYNAALAREARSAYPDDLAAQQEYVTSRSFNETDEWLWPSDSLRLAYLSYRSQMRGAWQTSQALMGVMVLTRVLSFFDVLLLSPSQSSRLGLAPIPDPSAPGVQVIYRF